MQSDCANLTRFDARNEEGTLRYIARTLEGVSIRAIRTTEVPRLVYAFGNKKMYKRGRYHREGFWDD